MPATVARSVPRSWRRTDMEWRRLCQVMCLSIPAFRTQAPKTLLAPSWVGSLNTFPSVRFPTISRAMGWSGISSGTRVFSCTRTIVVSLISDHFNGSISHQRNPVYRLKMAAFFTSWFEHGIFINFLYSADERISFFTGGCDLAFTSSAGLTRK